MNANAVYKFNVRKQINDIQYLIRLLNFEISQQEATKKKVTATVNAEKAIQIEKDKRESEMV
jgi:UDP-N-acetyl-D-mannosaminuronic acid transferase (WecB/TagA/CpsF family)